MSTCEQLKKITCTIFNTVGHCCGYTNLRTDTTIHFYAIAIADSVHPRWEKIPEIRNTWLKNVYNVWQLFYYNVARSNVWWNELLKWSSQVVLTYPGSIMFNMMYGGTPPTGSLISLGRSGSISEVARLYRCKECTKNSWIIHSSTQMSIWSAELFCSTTAAVAKRKS